MNLPNTMNVPPGGWRYLVPETSKTISGPNLPGLIQNINAHYKGAGYTMPHDIAQKIEAYMCGLPELREYCGGNPPATGRTSVVREVGHSFHAVVACLKTLITHRAGTGERPTQEQAEARAATCAACPLNSEATDCRKCNIGVIRQLVEKLVGTGTTSKDSQLYYCQVCHCANKAKIWTKHHAIWSNMPQSQKDRLPSNCWIVTEAAK